MLTCSFIWILTILQSYQGFSPPISPTMSSLSCLMLVIHQYNHYLADTMLDSVVGTIGDKVLHMHYGFVPSSLLLLKDITPEVTLHSYCHQFLLLSWIIYINLQTYCCIFTWRETSVPHSFSRIPCSIVLLCFKAMHPEKFEDCQLFLRLFHYGFWSHHSTDTDPVSHWGAYVATSNIDGCGNIEFYQQC